MISIEVISDYANIKARRKSYVRRLFVKQQALKRTYCT